MANHPKNILILGGSYAGVSTAHRILKQSAKAGLAIKITLVSPNTHLYWNIAATRAIVPGEITDEKLFSSIATGFKQYTADKFEFVVGTAEGLDVENKTVVVSRDSERSSLNYDILILATGSRPKEESPFKGKGSYQESLDLLHEWQAKVKNASSIYVAGAGATGMFFVYDQPRNSMLIYPIRCRNGWRVRFCVWFLEGDHSGE